MKTIVQLVSELKDYLLGKDTVSKQAVESNIAPVEADASSASQAYVVGEQLFLNDVLYDVTSPISVGDAIAVGTNITAANKLSVNIQTLTNNVDVLIENGAKNLCPNNRVGTTVVQGGLTWVFNSDGTVSVTGTNTQDFNTIGMGKTEPLKNGETYVISGSKWVPSGNCYIRVSKKDGTIVANSSMGTPASFVADGGEYYVVLYLRTVNTTYDVTFEPMLCLKELYDLDSTYAPPTKTNLQLTKETTGLLDNTEVNGAVNMLPNNATTQTINGITFTVNPDKTVTVSGTQTASPVSLLLNTDFSNLENGKTYKVTGSNGTSGRTEVLEIRDMTAGTNIVEQQAGVAAEFTYNSSHTYKASITLRNNGTTHSTTFKPMITVPSYNGDYVPYAKSNRELTEDVESLDAMYDGKKLNVVNDCDTPFSIGNSNFAINYFSSASSNAPGGNGVLLTWSSSANYGGQIAFNDIGLFYRKNSKGTISAWQNLVT
jgi:hypothetical protein